VRPCMKTCIAIFILAISCLAFSAYPSLCEMGYDVTAGVGSSTLDVHRSTKDFIFDIEGNVNGLGSFSRYDRINGFMGVDAYDYASAAKQSRIEYGDQMLLRSREGPVKFTVAMESGTNTSFNETKFEIEDSAHIEIDEKWPIYLASTKKIKYLGPGLSAKERYENNGDVVASSIQSWKLSKESVYRAQANRSLIVADLSPERLEVERRMNRSSIYMLNMESSGILTNLQLSRLSPTGEVLVHLSQDYRGKQKIRLGLGMNQSMLWPDEDDTGMELPCCSFYY
jgi:hypothetical protein